MTKKRMIKRNLLLAVACTVLIITSFVSNYQVSKANTTFVQYDCTTWEKTKDDVTYSIDIQNKSKIKVSFSIIVTSESDMTVSIEVNNSKISGGKSTFKYTDSWGNEGKGTIYFNKKAVYLKLSETKQEPTALWGVGNLDKCKFKLISNNFG